MKSQKNHKSQFTIHRIFSTAVCAAFEAVQNFFKGVRIAVAAVILGIVEKCTLTKVDVKAVLIALEEVIIEQLKNGNSVRFGNLGSFRPSLKSRFWDSKKGKWGTGGCLVPTDQFNPETGELANAGVKAENIAGINVVFTKSGEMTKKLDRVFLNFRMIPGEKAYQPKNNKS